MRRLACFAITTLFLAIGCGRSSLRMVSDDGAILNEDDAGDDDSGSIPTNNVPAVILNECGPADGPAFILRGSTVALKCSLEMNTGDFDEVVVWNSLGTMQVDVTDSKNGTVRTCKGAACTQVPFATIRFDTISPSNATGVYELFDRNHGTIKRNHFTAMRCNNRVMCG